MNDPMLPPNAVFLAVAFNLVGTSTYMIATLRGQTRPNRVTWMLWALAPLVAFGAEVGEGVGLRSLTTFMVGFGPLLIFLSSFVNRDAYWQITRFDKICGAISVAALVLWGLTRVGNVAIALSIVADLVAGIPTAAKAYRAPETENPWAFGCASISATIGLLTVTATSFANVAFPIYIIVFAGGMFVLIRFPRLRPPGVRTSITARAADA